jgi:putative glutamine amidotransferase
MTKPLIGLTTSRMRNPTGQLVFGTNEPYSISISNAGGLPVLIPLNLSDEDLDAVLTRLDGILFTGGYDIDPRRYGNPPHPRVESIDAERDHLEMHLVNTAVRSHTPFLGICRGCQVINVALGGSLYEHLPEQFSDKLQHDNHDHPRDFLAHRIRITPDSLLAQILAAETARVNSLHHQGIRQLAESLHATAHAPDGLVEAFELSTIPFGLAVQWHPEELQQHESMRDLFRQFVHACQPVGD